MSARRGQAATTTCVTKLFRSLLLPLAWAIVLLAATARAAEFTFELEDKDEACFFESIERKGQTLTLEYQVRLVE